MRKLPSDPDLERAVLGALFINPKMISKIKLILNADDFYHEDHSKIYVEVINADSFDMVSMERSLRIREPSRNWVDILGNIVSKVLISAGIEKHAKILKDLSVKRKIIASASDITDQAFNDTVQASDTLTFWKSKIREIQSDHLVSFEDSRTVVNRVFKDIERKYETGEIGTGVRCGISAIDDNLFGFEPKTLTYLIGRPSMGKTALALEMAGNMALSGWVLYFSHEMGREAIVRRRLSSTSKVFLSKIRTGDIRGENGESDKDVWGRIIDAANKLSDDKLIVVDSPSLKVVQKLIDFSETIHMDYPLTAIFVDHVQLMRARGAFGSRHLEISYISDELKGLAKSLNIPVIALCQLNRNLESRINKRPQLQDMRESGALEQDADIVIGIYREDRESSEMELGCLKGRDSGTWVHSVYFNRFIQKITDNTRKRS